MSWRDQFEKVFEEKEEIIQPMGFYPLCSAMCEALGISKMINEPTGPWDKHTILDFGTITKAFILDMLNQRSPLYKFSASFEDVDYEVHFGKGPPVSGQNDRAYAGVFY